MHNPKDKEVQSLFAQMHIPEPASNLESRILAAATARNSQAARKSKPATDHVPFYKRWSQPKLTFAYAMAALAIVVAVDVGLPELMGSEFSTPVSGQQLAAHSTQPVDRYTVDGISLLGDIEVSDNTEYEMAEIAELVDKQL